MHGHHLRKSYPGRPVNPRMAAIENNCGHCGIKFISKKGHRHDQPFCSRFCAGARGRVAKECIECGISFEMRKSQFNFGKKGYFCSRECRYKNAKIQALIAARPGTYRSNAWKIFERKCVDCEWKEYPELLIIHHVDGDRANGALDNLVPLCPTCHAVRHLFMDSGAKRVPSYRGQILGVIHG